MKLFSKRVVILGIYIIIYTKEILQTYSQSVHLNEHWNDFKSRYNKTYHPKIETKKRIAWEVNFHAIRKHNQEATNGVHNYTLELNHLTDLSERQYMKEMIKLAKSTPRPRNQEITGVPHHVSAEIPDELDWRRKGFVTRVDNQENCGSCYAFSVASCIQGQVFKTKNVIENFSIQQIIDCSLVTGNLGCSGGSLRNTLRYLQQAGGLMHESDYPYKAKQKICEFRKPRASVRIKSWAILPPKDENALKIAIAVIGPLAVSVNASPSTFQFYSSGIYDDPNCTSDYVNHAMLLVGYTKNAWILKNWWSEEWGENGYMLLARGSNKCAIANYAAYATIH